MGKLEAINKALVEDLKKQKKLCGKLQGELDTTAQDSNAELEKLKTSYAEKCAECQNQAQLILTKDTALKASSDQITLIETDRE